METPIDVIVSGHLCLDLLPEMDHVPLNGLASPGRLFEVGPLRLSTGGAVPNTGLALHQLGLNVRLMASVGDDLVGGLTVAFLKDRDAALTKSVTIRKGQTSAYTIVLSPEKVDRIFLHCTGPNATFGANDVNYELVAQARVFHLGYPPILPHLIEQDGQELAVLFQRASETGVVTSLDTSLPDPDGVSGHVDWRKLLAKTLPYVDIFVPSLEEILFMLRRSDYDRWSGTYLDQISFDYLHDVADELLGLGHTAIVGFKLGELGIYLQTGSDERFARLRKLPIDVDDWIERTVWHPAFQVDVVGTTGAGDSAYAGLLAALIKGYSMDDAARWACAIGACNVEAADAINGIRTWSATQQRLNAGWPYRDRHLAGL